MINVNHLIRVSMAWVSILYVVCYALVALFPMARSGFMMYGLHTKMMVGQNIFSVGTFVWGLIIWNIIAIIAFGLFATLYNSIKK